MTFRDHINYTEEKCTKLIFPLSKSAKITWGLKYEALKTIYTGGILPLSLYGAPVRKSVLDKHCYKAKLIRIQRLISIRIAKAYRKVSNEALCVIAGIKPIHIKIEDAGRYYEISKGKGIQYDREMEVKNWIHPAKRVKINEGHENSPHYIQAYTYGSKNGSGVVSGIAVLSDNTLTATLKYRLDGRCSNNQAKQMAILKTLEYIQYSKADKDSPSIYRQPDNTNTNKKPEETYTYRTNQDQGHRNGTARMDSGIQLD